MTDNINIRTFDMRRDMEQLSQLTQICFADELALRGGDFYEQLRSMRRVMPLITALGWFSENFRHLFDGFVIEDKGRIVATVFAQKTRDKTQWEIGKVATHPDYRRRGLARRLISHTIEHARAHGAEICTLYVLAENTPAYNLYRSLGFVHYDSLTELSLNTLPEVQASPLNGYTLRPMKTDEGQARYEVTVRETPQAVQDFLPIREQSYRVSTLPRLALPLFMRLQRIDSYLRAFEHDGQVVGYTHLEAHRDKTSHRLTLRVAPAHRAALAEPMLTLALQTLQEYPRENVLFSMRTDYTDLLDLVKSYGFVEIETQHWLGLKLAPAAQRSTY
jgi:ribosomal protein S18 acetylase RimI-like enzyme